MELDKIKFEFRFPTLEDNFEAQEIYFKEYEKAKEKGVLTKEQMAFYLKKYEIFTAAMDIEFANLEADDFFKYPPMPVFDHKDLENRYIEKCVTEIVRGIKVLSMEDLLSPRKKEEKNPSYLEYRELNSIKHSYMKFTCEGLAESRRLNYLVSRCVFNPDTKKHFWKSHAELLKEKNNLFISLLSGKLIEFWTGFNSTIMRHIARHSIWRTRWIGATKLSCPLFAGNITEWDINKTFLVYWSNFYDNIYANVDDLDDYTIKNDKFLDHYLENRHREKKNNQSLEGKEGIKGHFQNIKVNPLPPKK